MRKFLPLGTPRLGRPALLVLAALCLGPAGVSANPKWEPVMLHEQGMFYIDPQSLQDRGERKEIWSVLDYRKPQFTAEGKPYLSIQAQVWINCRAKMGRIMHLTYYSASMLGGKEVQKQGMLQDWQEIAPDTPVQKIARRVC